MILLVLQVLCPKMLGWRKIKMCLSWYWLIKNLHEMGIQFCIMRVSQSPMRALSTLHMRKYLRALPDCWANMSLISYTVPRLDLIHKVLAICPIEMPTINLDVCAKDAVKLLRMRRLAANRHDCSLWLLKR